MAISDGYCTGAELETHMGSNRTGFSTAGDVELAIEAAARDIDAWCGRRFYADASASARTFYPASPSYLPIDDAWLVTALTIDGTSADPADYDEVPLNGVRDGIEGWPVLGLRVPDDGTAPTGFYRKCVVTAKWGWTAVPTAVKSANLLLAAELLKTGDIPMIDEFQQGSSEMKTVYRQLRVYRDGLRAVPVA